MRNFNGENMDYKTFENGIVSNIYDDVWNGCGDLPIETISAYTKIDFNILNNTCITDLKVQDFLKVYAFSKYRQIFENGLECNIEKVDKNKKKSLEKKTNLIENKTDKKDDATSNYDEAIKKAQNELFKTDRLIEELPTSELKHLIYINKWYNEFDSDLMNDRVSMLLFLYKKLEEKARDIILEKEKTKAKDFYEKSDLIEIFNKISDALGLNG